MRKPRVQIDQLVVETFEMGVDPLALGGPGSSGNGCTVLTTCSPDCCDTATTQEQF